jgi:hypothetical protein
MRKLAVGVVLGAIMVCAPSIASDRAGTYVAVGPGFSSCGAWLQSGVDFRFEYVSWVEGFVSAYNEFVWGGKNIMDSTDSAGMEAWLNSYCAAHPVDSVAQAANAFIEEMKAKPHVATN